MAYLAVYGHINIDTILLLEALPDRNTTVPALGEIDRLGGTGATIARCAASLGVPTALAGFVGDDFPTEYRQMMEALNIDLTDVRTLPGKTPHCWLLSVPGGDTSAVMDDGIMKGLGAAPMLDTAHQNAETIHLTTGDPTMHFEVAKAARKAKKRVVFDPGQELRYRYDQRTLERFLNQSWAFICNQHELALALEAFDYGDPMQLHDHVDNVIVTRGAQGAEWRTTKDTITIPACPIEGDAPPETTGAGDAFRGGLHAALHAQLEPKQALRWATAANALYLEAKGATLPTRDTLRQRLDRWLI